MAKITLPVEVRLDLSRRNLKKIRKEENIPAVVYAEGKENLPVQISYHDFSKLAHGEYGGSLESIVIDLKIKDGKKAKTVPTIIKEIQYDFIKGDVLHIDFNQISLTKKIHTRIPIVAKGDSVGERHGGIVEHIQRELEVSCLPGDLPEEVIVHIDDLDVGNAIHVREIDLGPDVEILNEPDQTVITVLTPRKVVEEEVEEVEEEITEPEVVGEKLEAGEEEQKEE